MSNAVISGGGGISGTVTVSQGGTGRTSLTDGAVLVGDGTNPVELIGPLTDGQLLIGNTAGVSPSAATLTAGDNVTISNGAGSITIAADLAPKKYFFAAEGLTAEETNFAAPTKLTGSNVKVKVLAFDDSTEEYSNGKLEVPSDALASGTVTFRAYVSAATAAASKNIGLTFGHLALGDDEDWDPASPYTDEDSGATAISATQDDVTLVTWTETFSNLGWAANDLVLFRVSRDVSVANNLSGDMYLFSFSVEIPRG